MTEILREQVADEVYLYLPDVDPFILEHAHVTVYTNGMVNIVTKYQDILTTTNNCTVLWVSRLPDEEESPLKVVSFPGGKDE